MRHIPLHVHGHRACSPDDLEAIAGGQYLRVDSQQIAQVLRNYS
jgi:hypothetical protein